MRIKLDENLPAGLVPVLQSLGHDVETVPGEGLSGQPDGEIAAAAHAEGRFLVSQDLDFSDRRRLASGTMTRAKPDWPFQEEACPWTRA